MLIWETTLSLIGKEGRVAEKAAMASTHELVETYEAQVLRAVREVDQTLKFVNTFLITNEPQPTLRAGTA
jgi:hypothetical protein